MMNLTGLWTQYRDELASDPFLVLALTAALVALATTPLAFAVLGRLEWFKARRGRIMQRPEFSSIVVGMMLVMAIPAIFAALVLKSRSFDRNRYEFDPNRTWSVLEQGREYKSVKAADAAVKVEMERLALERKNLVNNVKKLDEAMLALAGRRYHFAGCGRAIPEGVAITGRSAQERRAGRSATITGFHRFACRSASARRQRSRNQRTRGGRTGRGAYIHCPTSPPRGGRQRVKPDPDRRPRLPACPSLSVHSRLCFRWRTFRPSGRWVNRVNGIWKHSMRKIYTRRSMAARRALSSTASREWPIRFYHPAGDPSNELQLYVFEMADSLKALGKYGSEKPDEVKTVAIGTEGYTSAGSTLFYSGKYYTQIVSTQDDPKFAAFALELARRVAARQTAGTAAHGLGGRRLRPPANQAHSTTAANLPRSNQPPPWTQACPRRGYPGDLFRDVTGPGASRRLQVRCPGRFWL